MHNHLKSTLIVGAMLLAFTRATPQPSTEMDKTRADMAVPDAPAFKILDVDPSNIMRPSNVREVGVTVSNFLLGGGALPKAFAAEFAPLLLPGNVSLQEYRDSPGWYGLRISAGTKQNSIGGTDLAIGLRVSICDSSDPRTDEKLVQGVKNFLSTIKRREKKLSQLASGFVADTSEAFASFASEQTRILAYEMGIDQLREEEKEKNWNKRICELGFAIAASSSDSLARNLATSKYGLWLSVGYPICEQWQLLMGLKGLLGRNTEGKMKEGEFSLAARGYYGRNTQKGFLELDFTSTASIGRAFTFSIGGELDLTNGFWLDASYGFKKIGSSPLQGVSSFSVRAATPESKAE